MSDASEDLEAIRQLKARYCRFVDTQQWDALRELFAPDAGFDLGDGMVFSDRDGFVAFVASALTGAQTVHHVLAPEITLTGPSSAEGIWAMRDVVDRGRPGEGVLRGYGHYHETYRKDGGRWFIAALRLTRLRVEFTGA